MLDHPEDSLAVEDKDQAEGSNELQIDASQQTYFFRMSHIRQDGGKIAVGDPKTNRTEYPGKPTKNMRNCQNYRQGQEINQKDKSP